ncbi:transmembrane protein [Mycobacterium lentiflavum]|uniref:Transmembrane protein n=2 Tax=Mycobacterium lentiflavum TaxID=141349 RepID=A0A0E4CMZ4_MYCLN|nr:transmembrane protein [Mycobacterium lentiflavum]
MGTEMAVAVAVTFVWLGMVLAISFLEAPLKFRAPNVTLQIGLGIGRLVFRALNTVEVAFAIIILAVVVDGPMPLRIGIAFGVAIATLAIQLIAVRPRLTRRSDQVLAGLDAPRSRAHYAYVGLEVVKAVALIVTGILLLTA